jgi:uncharacterized protein (TIGR00299 family) protein
MKTLYLDLFSGISGDMFLGALLDLGVDFEALQRELGKLNVRGYHLHAACQLKGGIEGMKFDVHLEAGKSHGHSEEPHHHEHEHPGAHAHPHPHDHEHGPQPEEPARRTYADIRDLIAQSTLSEWAKQKAVAIFHRVAQAEARIHGEPVEAVHFHEVGAIDSIVDIVGACIALEQLGKPRVLASPVVEGTGWIDCAHGRLPIPAPATLEILSARGVPLTQCEEPHELVTPTGAALLAELVERFEPMHGLAPTRVGYGVGSRDNQSRPNVLRAVLCDPAPGAHDWEIDRVALVQTNLDDMNPEILGRVMQQALERGALDVYYTPVQMKKNRPGVLLTVLCGGAEADAFAEFLLRETTAFGVRVQLAERRKLQREFVTVNTPHGPVAVKLGKLDGQVLQAAPEYESCRRLAEQAGIPLKQVYEAALRTLPV